jgi:3-hydroxybutyryl-CoA dehydrogenase
MITVVCTDLQKTELLSQGVSGDVAIEWLAEPTDSTATVYIDLLFDNSPERINQLKQKTASLVFVNHMAGTAEAFPSHFIRINGWPGFLSRSVIECALSTDENKKETEKLFSYFNKKVMWVPDAPGFVSARVVAMIVNEAYFALGEGVSTREEIDTAMKLGTNYPHGPFEWATKIGIKNICTLLMAMGKINPRYHPCGELIKEANKQ